MKPIRLLATLALLLVAAALRAEVPVISLLTCRPGADIYELEGHSGLRIHVPGGEDVTVNWGLFDFNSPNFVYRFVKGETDYCAGAIPTPYFVGMYEREGRAVYEQVLQLDSVETMRLVSLVTENLLPENRVYRYNYVLDNCATRPLALIERAVADTLRLNPSGSQARTFREVMRSFHTNYPWYQFGIDLALGSGIDRPISAREHSFAPELLGVMMTGATRPDGRIIAGEGSYIAGYPELNAVEGPTPWPLTPMCVGVSVLLLAAAVSWMQLKGRTLPAKLFDTLYYAAAGAAGLVLTFLIFVSVHEATSPNWLYLWLNPLCFIPAVCVWLKKGKGLEICSQSVNFALLTVLTVILLAGIQSPNPAFWPLIAADAVRSLSTLITARRAKRAARSTN